jgi:hypothetical protein
VAITSPVAGLVASNVSPLALGCQLPLTNIFWAVCVAINLLWVPCAVALTQFDN